MINSRNPSLMIDTVQPVDLSHPLNNGLVGWWLSLPGMSGGPVVPNLLRMGDTSSSAGHGILTGFSNNSAPWYSSASNGFPALDYKGTDDYVSIPATNELNNISVGVTLSAFVYPRQSSATNYAIFEKSIGEAVNKQFLLINDNSSNLFWRVVRGGNLTALSAFVILSTNTPYHVLATYVSGDSRLYVNGVLRASSTSITGAIDTGSGTSRIGSLFTAGFFADARIGDVRIHNRVVTHAEALQTYDQFSLGYPGLLRRLKQRAYSFGAPATGNRRRRVICGS